MRIPKGAYRRAAGFIRSTVDVDLVIETGADYETGVIQALQIHPDRAARENTPGEVAQCSVVRVGEEIMVDPGDGPESSKRALAARTAQGKRS